MARERAGITQRELARLMNVTRSACSQWEKSGIGGPRFGRLLQLAEILRVNYEWLATGLGHMERATAGVAETRSDYHVSLTSTEKRLLKLFRAMSRNQQRALLELLDERKK